VGLGLAPDQVAALGAFLSGVGSVVSAYLGIRFERKRGLEDCARRLDALREGMKLEHEMERERWSERSNPPS